MQGEFKQQQNWLNIHAATWMIAGDDTATDESKVVVRVANISSPKKARPSPKKSRIADFKHTHVKHAYCICSIVSHGLCIFFSCSLQSRAAYIFDFFTLYRRV